MSLFKCDACARRAQQTGPLDLTRCPTCGTLEVFERYMTGRGSAGLVISGCDDITISKASIRGIENAIVFPHRYEQPAERLGQRRPVVFLGAGASFASESFSTHPTPPLGSRVFAALLEAGTLANEFPEELKEKFLRDGFEAGMAHFCRERDSAVMRFQKEVAAYFAGFQPSNENLYLKLLRELHEREVVFSTLNYDLLLEQSAEKLGKTCHYGLSLDGANSIAVLKPHGSSNLWPNVAGVKMSGLLTEKISGARIDADVLPLSRADTLQCCSLDQGYCPAMACYMEGKRVDVSPWYIENQQRMMCAALADAPDIYISGVGIMIEDSHLWIPISNSPGKVTYFGLPGYDERNFENWKAITGRESDEFILGGFDVAVESIPALVKSRVGNAPISS